MVENNVTNHLQKSIVFNYRRLLRKRNLAVVPGDRLDDVNVDQRLATERDSSSRMALFYAGIFLVH